MIPSSTGMTADPGPAADPEAPYVRLAVVGLISRPVLVASADRVRGLRSGGAPEEWLLLRRVGEAEIWDPAGGRVERGEGLEVAVIREMREETGLEVAVAGPCYAYLTFHKGERLIAVSMSCRVPEGTDVAWLEPENAVDWRWVTAEEWGILADEGRSSWRGADVLVATRLASTLWEATGE